MVKIDDPRQDVAAKIYQAYEDNREDWRREHLGASVIGKECDLRIWFGFRWWADPSFSGRMLRLFERGNREEEWLADDLRAAGMDVSTVDPETGEQYRWAKLGGHFGGSTDAVILNVPMGGSKEHIGEFKTVNEKGFKKMVKDGLQATKPEHYVQTQLYMSWRGVDSAIYIMVCKNTDEMYVERVKLDVRCVAEHEARAEAIIFGAGRPARMTDNPTFWKCKFCDFQQHCHFDAEPEKNCRTCTHAKPDRDGSWRCTHSKFPWMPKFPIRDLEDQKAGCDAWEVAK